MNATRLSFAVALLLSLGACKPSSSPESSQSPAAQAPAASAAFASKDVVEGSGEAIKSGETAVVHYTGWLYEPAAPDHHGQQFDSSRTHGAPFRFPVGGGRVIKGWDEGVVGMKVGGRRELVIPPEMGYGEEGAGGVIPPNATLIFDVELLGIE